MRVLKSDLESSTKRSSWVAVTSKSFTLNIIGQGEEISNYQETMNEEMFLFIMQNPEQKSVFLFIIIIIY